MVCGNKIINYIIISNIYNLRAYVKYIIVEKNILRTTESQNIIYKWCIISCV